MPANPPLAMQEYEASFDEEDDVEATAKCKRCALGDFLPVVVLSLVLAGFCVLGGFIFMKIENNECARVNQSVPSQCILTGNDWDLDQGFRFTVSLVTTIGYGDLAPRTNDGRLLTIFIGVVGIPLAFATFLKCGKIAAYFVLCIYTQILTCGLCKKEEEDEEEQMNGMNTITSRASIYTRQVSKVEVKKAERGRFGAVVIGILIFIGYVVGTSFLIRDHFIFKDQATLSFVDSLYFNFVTLSLTGFGDLIPIYEGLFQLEAWEQFLRAVIFYAYLTNGITIIFMNIILIRMEVNRLWFTIKTKLGIV